jgi:hypothetical protein
VRNRLLLLIAVIDALAFASCGGGDGNTGPPPQSTIEPAASSEPAPTTTSGAGGIAAIAINVNALEEFPIAVFWAGESNDAPTVPSGYWHLVVSDESGVRRTGDAVESNGSAPLDLGAADEQIPGDDGEAEAAFEALASYVVLSHASYLASLNVLTGGFDYPPFDPSAAVSGDDAEQLLLLIGEREAARGTAGRAIDVLGRERLVAASAGPAAGLFDALKENIEDPIKAQEAAARARQDLALAFGRMTISQQAEAFRQLTEERGLEIDAADAAEFIEQLEAGDHDFVAAQARNFLQNHEDFFDYFDLRNIQTAREEGAKLVIAGSEFYANAVKEVLSKQFPGIEKGWDAIEDLENKLQRLLNPEIKPADVAAILRELGYDISDEEAESFVQTIAYSIELLRAQAGDGAAPAATPAGQSADGEWAVYDMAPIEKLRHGALGILVAEVDKVNDIKICTISGGGLCEGDNANITLAQAGGVVMILGPFESYDDAVAAFCDNIIPGTVKDAAIIGTIADMKYDGNWHAIYNAPACP